MKRVTLILSIFLVLSANIVFAGPTTTGIGFISGEPTGISMKFPLDENTAVDAAVAWSFVDDSSLHLHADWLVHNWSYLKDAFEVKKGELPLYYGIGGRVLFDDDTKLGARFVLGMSYVFEDAPFDLFLEVAPVMNVIPKTEAAFNSAIGVRFWIK